jgi:hypothetical protein
VAIDKKLDKIQEDISDIKVIMARNTESLEIHIKRSDLLEAKMQPVEQHVAMIQGAMKLISVMAATAAIVEAIHRVLK